MTNMGTGYLQNMAHIAYRIMRLKWEPLSKEKEGMQRSMACPLCPLDIVRSSFTWLFVLSWQKDL